CSIVAGILGQIRALRMPVRMHQMLRATGFRLSDRGRYSAPRGISRYASRGIRETLRLPHAKPAAPARAEACAMRVPEGWRLLGASGQAVPVRGVPLLA